MSKKTAIVICPGRGTYNQAELGYLARHHSGPCSSKPAFLEMIDRVRADAGQGSITALDGAAQFSSVDHGSGENASLLIYACAMADFFAINRDEFNIVGVTGNSMGWYLSLAASGVLSLENGARLVNGMGQIMAQHGEGGQVVYPRVDEDWKACAKRQKLIDNALSMVGDLTLSTSIHLGGLHVFAGGQRGVRHCLLYTSPSPRDRQKSRMPSSA